MRTLSSTLTDAQIKLDKPPIWKVVLSRSQQNTRGYDNSRILKISRTEEPDSYKADIVLSNHDGALTTLDFEHYQAVISKGYATGVTRSAWVAASTYVLDDIVVPVTANGYQYRCSIAGAAGSAEPTWPTDLGVTVANSAVTWEMDGNTGDEYSRTAPLRVRAQDFHSGVGLLKCLLSAVGLPNQLSEDKAIAEHTQTSANTSTVKTLLTAVGTAGTGLTSSFNGYTAITIDYDSEDSVIGNFAPAEYFSISINTSRWSAIQELLGWTGSKIRTGNDGDLHVLDPVISGTAYNNEYKFNVDGSHNFWTKGIRLRFIQPNEVRVRTPADYAASAQFAGTAISTASNALATKTQTFYARVTSTAQASSIASAKIEQLELGDERGFVTVPPHVGQELWDYVKVTDSRQDDTRVGNIQFIRDEVEIFPGTSQRPNWTMVLSFGKITQQNLQASIISPSEASIISPSEAVTINIQKIADWMYDLMDTVAELDNRVDILEAQSSPSSPVNIFASVSQTSAGLLLQKAVTPNSLAVSTRGSRILAFALNGATALTTSDKAYQRIPADMNGFKLIKAEAMVKGASSSGAVTLTVKNGATSMLSTNITIDVSEYDTLTAAAPPVVDAAEDDVATGDQIEVACTGAGTGVTYCVAVLTFILDV